MRKKLTHEDLSMFERLGIPYSPEEHFGRVMCNEPIASAYEWIVAYADSLVPKGTMSYHVEEQECDPVTVTELINAALADGGDWNTYICRGGLFEGHSPDPMLFEMLSRITGKHIEYSHFFTCSC